LLGLRQHYRADPVDLSRPAPGSVLCAPIHPELMA
jgi:hypothetical protein